MATINLRFAFEKETKGAVLQEISEDGKPVFAEHWQALHSQVGTARWEDSPDADRYHHDLTRRFSGSTSIDRPAADVLKRTMRENVQPLYCSCESGNAAT